MIKRLRDTLIVLLVGLLVCAGAFVSDKHLKPFENLIYDVMMRVSAQPFEGSDLIMLVDVDEASLDRVGQWPWPRNRLATIVERVNAGGALVLVFDMFFSEPDRMSPDQVLSEMQHAGNSVRVNDAIPLSYDRLFAEAISGGPVVLGQNSLIRSVPSPGRLRPWL